MTHPIQSYLDTMSDSWKNQRSQYHLTLGKLISILEGIGDMQLYCEDARIAGELVFVDKPHSYRGYYSDLAFEPSAEKGFTTKGLLKELKENVIGKTFTGYKGGDFLMDEKTPLWLAPYGSSTSVAIIDTRLQGDQFILTTKLVDL